MTRKKSATPAAQARIWTVAEAKARLSEVLRLAREEGPQHIGTRDRFVVVPEPLWRERCEPRPSLGRWLVETLPRSGPLPLDDRRDPPRTIPFSDQEGASPLRDQEGE